MNKIKDLSSAPASKSTILSTTDLISRLKGLVGNHVPLTRKPRTDGANIRKMISKLLEDRISNALDGSQYEILPPRKKGVPRILLELIDTYVVTSGDSYNLQVWNRMPNSNNPLIRYQTGETISSKDIRLVFVKINPDTETIESIVVLTPQYVEDKFGKFGKPTIKQQLLVSRNQRHDIVENKGGLFLTEDTDVVANISTDVFNKPIDRSDEFPQKGKLLSLSLIKDKVALELIGYKLNAPDTKTRGQLLEKKVISLLGYDEVVLVGGYPDIPNQLLEVKVQDTQTIDLGRYSPQFVEIINEDYPYTTEDVRYLIALTNSTTKVIEGVIISSGKALGDIFTYVSDTSYKCQRAIPMSFFDNYTGQCIFNP